MEHEQPSASPVNVADGHAYVGQQIGSIAQNIVHHNTYEARGDSPLEKFARARGFLAIGAAQKAVEWVEQALADRLETTEVGYYWQLALLAGRPFDHLSAEDLEKLGKARELARHNGNDQWTEATDAISGLLRCYAIQETKSKMVDDEPLKAALADIRRLPEVRREEINRHLASLLHGAVQDGMDDDRRRQIEDHRMGNDRRKRVPLFFEPDPAEPLLRPVAPSSATFETWAKLMGGSALVIGAVALLLRRAVAEDVIYGGLIAVWLLISGIGAAIHALRWLHEQRRRDRFVSSSTILFVAREPSELDQLVTRRFGAAGISVAQPDLGPGQPAVIPAFPLTRALAEVYGPARVPASQLDWLVKWHVDQMLRGSGWYRCPDVVSEGAALLWGASAVVSLGAAVVLTAHWSVGAVFSLFVVGALLAAGGHWLLAGSTVYTEKRRVQEETIANAGLLDAERSVWLDEQRRLQDRPDDAQMAEWLDYDKDHIRLSALKQWGLSNQDVIEHVVLTEPDPNSSSARVPRGPRRYTSYKVRLFLLTGNGVRQLDVNLDFANGAENKQHRRAFKYDAIASAQIEEPTVRRYGRSQIASPAGGGRPDGHARPIRRQSLRLTLVNNERVDINAEYDSLLADEDKHDNDALLALEMETSGAVSTLRTLETVAGEGREWIKREQDRNRHLAQDYQRTYG